MYMFKYVWKSKWVYLLFHHYIPTHHPPSRILNSWMRTPLNVVTKISRLKVTPMPPMIVLFLWLLGLLHVKSIIHFIFFTNWITLNIVKCFLNVSNILTNINRINWVCYVKNENLSTLKLFIKIPYCTLLKCISCIEVHFVRQCSAPQCRKA